MKLNMNLNELIEFVKLNNDYYQPYNNINEFPILTRESSKRC